jgi:prepilin-type N-terminal cleavage/methylation domain-containing protein
MSIAPVRPSSNPPRSGFTLLEIMLAVAILAMMSMAIYRFVQSNILALRISTEASAADARFDSLRDLLTAEFQNVPSGVGALTGDPLKVNDRSRDEVRWIGDAGIGVLTRYAGNKCTVALRIQQEKNSDKLDLGLLRKPSDDVSFTDVHESWVPLLQDVRSLQVRYFDSRLNVWVTRWSDTVTLPRLVRVTIERNDAAVPWEAVIPLGRTPL